MQSVQDRAIEIIYKKSLEDWVRASEITYSRWKSVRHRTVRMSTEEIDVIQKVFPEYSLWLISGQIAPEIGQISPDYEEASQKLSNQS